MRRRSHHQHNYRKSTSTSTTTNTTLSGGRSRQQKQHLVSMFHEDESNILEYSEAVLASNQKKKVYNAEGQLSDPYAHFFCRSRAYILRKR